MTESGAVVEFPIPGRNPLPNSIILGPDGALWFADYGNGNIDRLTISGDITTFKLPLEATYSQIDLAFGPDGNLWFTMGPVGKIGRMTPQGVFSSFMVPTLPFIANYPVAITSGPDGALWFCDLEARAVGRITTAGVIVEFPLPAGENPISIAAGPDAVWVGTNGLAHAIVRVGPSGQIQQFDLPDPFFDPISIAAGPDGAIWFVDDTANRVGRLTTAGVLSWLDVPTPGAFVAAICAGPDGNMWFTEASGNKIGRVSLGMFYYTLPPCRVLDTRNAAGPFGGPAFGPSELRSFPLAGACGIPSDAVVVSGNVVAVGPSAAGDFRAYAADQPMPPTSVLNFDAGRTRANNLLVALSTDGTQSVTIQNNSAGAANVVFDVNGYFK
jgi:virginiamycin B lyase